MFARVAALGVAALLCVAPPSPCDHIGKFADADASGAMNLPVVSSSEANIVAPIAAEVSGVILPDTNLLDTNLASANARPANLPQDDMAQPSLAALDRHDQAAVVRPAPSEPFGLKTLPWFSGDIFEKWTKVNAAINADRNVLARCRKNTTDCPPAARKFLAVIAAGLEQTGRARVGVINRAINLAIEHMSDLEQWGVDERWSPPLETFATGRGDCEDYAIAKFVALTEAGVPAEDVRLVVVHDRTANDGHAVAAVHVDDGWVLLDNRWLTLVDDDKMHRMIPLFVIDQSGVRTYLRMPPNTAALASASLGIPLAN
jgi:predicted transglutaminase-like cysteine proteinase